MSSSDTDPDRISRLPAIAADANRPAIRTLFDMVRERGVHLEKADAADWVEARLAEPQREGVTRVLMHSVVWQYLPDTVAERIRVAMKAAGARATAERPLAWVSMEPDRALAVQIVSVRTWPGDSARAVIATSHAHGTWIRPGVPERDLVANPLVEAAAQVRL